MAEEPKKKQSYQFRALGRKTLSYQKRQMCTNICCVACCPFLMVLICGLLSIIVTALIAKLNTPQYYRYCSDSNVTNYATLVPTGGQNITFTDSKGDSHVRELLNIGPSGQCVRWFAEDYPYSFPYSPGPIEDKCGIPLNPELCPFEATVYPQPIYGWIQNPLAGNNTQLVVAGTAFGYYAETQMNFWSMVAAQSGVDPGTLTQGGLIKLFPPYDSVATPTASGLLGKFAIGYYTPNNINDYRSGNVTFQARPYFEPLNLNGNYSGVDDELMTLLTDVVNQIANLNPVLGNSSNADKMNYTLYAQQYLQSVPFGALLFDYISTYEYNYTMQIGTNQRLAAYSTNTFVQGTNISGFTGYPSYPTEGLRRIIQHTSLVQAILKYTASVANYTITQGLRVFPSDIDTAFTFPIGSIIGEILYPFGVSFLLPVFVVSIVKEKEDRILVMMRMNGMKTWVYWLSEYIHFYILHIITTIIFIITGFIFRLEFFTLTQKGVYILFFFVWGNTQIAMAFFLSTFFNKSRNALILVFCLVLAGVVLNVAITELFTGTISVGYFVYPPFAFYFALSLMNTAAFTASMQSYTMAMVVPGTQIFQCLMALIVETVFLFLLSFYIMEVVPSEYGIHRPWHFIFTEPYAYFTKKQRLQNPAATPDDSIKITLGEGDKDDDDHFGEDEDVQAERLRIYNKEYPADSPVIVKDMRKAYPNGKLAVKSVSLAIENNSVFGLLGPNGAGKTTLISILTGLYPPTAGDAYLAGFSVNKEMQDIYLNIGVCPQHDILWDDLTVEEHLLFYARIKGVKPKEEKAAVKKALETVSLQKFKNRLSKGLSGGEKRRLSIAISLIGDGKVVFLDEPTTGLDPEVRRLIWDIINKAKAGRTIILTTHSMEEAEVLCQRIGIMAKGTLRCLGPQVRLKNKYGNGFKISVSSDPKDHRKASSYVESLLPSGWVKLDNFIGNISYEFESHEISSLFKQIGENKDKYGIRFWGITQTTLEEVFLKIIKETDAEAS